MLSALLLPTLLPSAAVVILVELFSPSAFIQLLPGLCRYQTLALRACDVPDFSKPEEPPTTEALQKACKKIINKANLRGAQVGRTIVFLKYYHNETLLRLMQTQHAMATRLNNVARRFLAHRELVRRRAARAKAEAEARAKAEQEAAERAAAEALRREKEETERLAREAAERARLRALEEEKQASINAALLRKRQREFEAAELAAAQAKLEALRQVFPLCTLILLIFYFVFLLKLWLKGGRRASASTSGRARTTRS
jgi:hypothetical protein